MINEVNTKEEMNENLKIRMKGKQRKIRTTRQIIKGKLENCGNLQ